MSSIGLSTIPKILIYQLLIITIISCAMSYWGWQKGVSALFGGIAAFVPNLYLALRIGRSEKLDAKTLLHSFYFGEAVKLLLTAILFMLILQIPYIEILPLFGSYVAALSVFWFALLWH